MFVTVLFIILLSINSSNVHKWINKMHYIHINEILFSHKKE